MMLILASKLERVMTRYVMMQMGEDGWLRVLRRQSELMLRRKDKGASEMVSVLNMLGRRRDDS